MAFVLPQRTDIRIQWVAEENGFGLRWHRLLFPMVGMPSVHLGPIIFGNPQQLAPGHAETTGPARIDGPSQLPPGQDLGGLGAVLHAPDGAPAPSALGMDAAGQADNSGAFGHPPYFAGSPLGASPVSAPGDSAAPGAVTPGDLDPLVTATGSAGDHGAAADPGGGDLGAAFLPPAAGDIADLPHGLDLGSLFTPPPMPPPLDMI